MIITLIGYRGTGKSTVGRQLAAELGWRFHDVDPEIERRAGKSIAEIFAADGEPRFRDIEAEVLRDQLQDGPAVVVTGGGTLLRDENREAVRRAGIAVWLMARRETIAARILGDPLSAGRRPSLTGTDPVSEIASVLAVREPIYAQAATFAVTTDDRSVAEIVAEIRLRLPGPRPAAAADSPPSGQS